MVTFLGTLAVKFTSVGAISAGKKIGSLQSKFGKMHKSMKPRLESLTKGFKKFGLVAGAALGLLIASSPLLRARIEVLNIRIQELVRTFGDALAPIIETVTGLVEQATKIWEGLPEPLKQAIIFGVQVAAVVGLMAIAFGILSAAMSPVTLAILAIIAAGALLYLAWQTNFGGIRDITERVFEKIKPLFEAINRLLGGMGGAAEENTNAFSTAFEALGIIAGTVFETIGRYIGNLLTAWTGIITFIESVFKGDLKGALDSIALVFEAGIGSFFDAIMLPVSWIQGLITALTGEDIIGGMIKAGQDFIGAFITGAQQAIEDAGGILTDIIGLIGEFFGGSLPERGPLQNIDIMGKELGQAYIIGIGEGVGGNISTIDRSLRIDRLEMNVPGANMQGSSELFGELRSMKKARTW